MLYSTREKISQTHLNFLSNCPGTIDGKDYKKQCENDINRVSRLVVNQTNLKLEFSTHDSQYAKSEDKFEFARHRIEEKAKEIGIKNEDAEYFSYLMTNLCSQGFCATTFGGIQKIDGIAESILVAAVQKNIKSSARYELELKDNKLIYKSTNPFYYGTVDNPKCVEFTINYTFYPDKTMQMSMENPQDKIPEQGIEFFTMLSTHFTQNLKKIFGQNYKANDPFNVLAMDCDQKQCEIVTWLVNEKRYQPEIITNEEIDQLYAIEKLSKTKPYTMTRLIHQYIKNNPTKDLNLSNELHNKLSPEAQDNISKIADELQKRLAKNGVIIIEDTCNIIINFFLEIFKSFEWKLGESAVTTKEFDEFCVKLNSTVAPDEGQQSTFVKTYLEAKNKVHIQTQID